MKKTTIKAIAAVFLLADAVGMLCLIVSHSFDRSGISYLVAMSLAACLLLRIILEKEGDPSQIEFKIDYSVPFLKNGKLMINVFSSHPGYVEIYFHVYATGEKVCRAYIYVNANSPEEVVLDMSGNVNGYFQGYLYNWYLLCRDKDPIAKSNQQAIVASELSALSQPA